ncbi:MAG: hypothetical protein HYR94_05505 [Chloroflexi bacterium]|nr:hypothetical protein [Chloroflexota bacterium]
MLPNDKEFLARKEHYKALQREVEQARLVELVKLHQPQKEKIYRKLLGWIGGQLIRWGLKLQQDRHTRVNNLTELAENTD